MFYLWGYTSAFLVYVGLSYFFPAPETIIQTTIYEDSDVISAGSLHEDKAESDTADEKKTVEVLLFDGWRYARLEADEGVVRGLILGVWLGGIYTILETYALLSFSLPRRTTMT
ncbi:hypothetical protein GE09DRAFT_359738 [Coniochaeta sp. 2T2.1]|nr:hypothetical protein GE09DRAFT_359738 [Coniochaeta sp. 2T2.1]